MARDAVDLVEERRSDYRLLIEVCDDRGPVLVVRVAFMTDYPLAR